MPYFRIKISAVALPSINFSQIVFAFFDNQFRKNRDVRVYRINDRPTAQNDGRIKRRRIGKYRVRRSRLFYSFGDSARHRR